jgi:hypothetical protein
MMSAIRLGCGPRPEPQDTELRGCVREQEREREKETERKREREREKERERERERETGRERGALVYLGELCARSLDRKADFKGNL